MSKRSSEDPSRHIRLGSDDETKEHRDRELASPLSRLTSFLSLILLLLKRLLANPGLSAGIAAGLTAAVALATCVPLYADGVGRRMLMEQISRDEARPPFAFLFRYVGAWHGALEWEDIRAADAYLTRHVAGDLGLSLTASPARHARTAKWRLFPAEEAAYVDTRQPLGWLALGFLDGLAAHAEIIEGQSLPATAPSDEIPILVSQSLANRLGLQVGEAYVLFQPTGPGVSLPVRIIGIWKALDREPAYWPYPPRSFDEVLLTSESAFRDLAAPAVHGEIDQVVWYAVADGSHVTSGDVPGLLARIAAVRARLDGLLPHATLDLSPEEALRAYRQDTTRLTLLLYAFSIPIMGLVLYFVTLIAGMAVRRQRGETVVLRSRGGTKGQIVGLYLLQWSLLGLVALIIGWPSGWAAAILVGRTRSFLAFDAGSLRGGVEGSSFHAPLNWTTLRFGLLAVAISIMAAILPALLAARYTIVTHQQELARALRRPWWQRYFLDVILLIPAVYSYVLLRRPASPLSSLTQGDIFSNPLLFLAPVLFIFAWSLLLLRLLPRLMDGLARLSRRTRGVIPLLLFHDLSLQAGQLAGPLLLLVLTTALATFSASLALTLDIHLHDRIYYQVGADLRLVEQGEPTTNTATASSREASFSPGGNVEAGRGEGWVFLPIAEHLELPGVRAAARVGDYAAAASLGGQAEAGRFVGVDRLDFPDVAFFREDFASQSLGALMNALASDRRAILVERNFLGRHNLQPGDSLHLTLDTLGDRTEIEFIVAGDLSLFPSLYPEDGPFFVGNLRYLFQQVGSLRPYDVCLTTKPNSTERIIEALNERGVPVVSARDARNLIAAEQQRPQRQGLFGLLTLGFLAAGFLTVLGLALHALISFRERVIELGVLRALGLSLAQMRFYLASGQVVLLLISLLTGAVLGTVSGHIFIPFLQAGAGLHPHTPPFIAYTAWGDVFSIYALFAAATAFSVSLTLALLRRMRVYEAIKMGETE